MGLGPGGLDDHKDYVRDLIEKVNSCIPWHIHKSASGESQDAGKPCSL